MLDTENENILYEYAITTDDNPYDPFDDYSNWHRYDVTYHSDSSGYLARVAKLSDELSIAEIEEAKEEAIDEILKYDVFKMYKKVKRPIPKRFL